MAKTKYRVKKGDSFSNLGYSPQEIMRLNPGVPKLSAGQTIFLPSNNDNIRNITTAAGTNTGQFVARTAGAKDTVTLPSGKNVRLAPWSTVTVNSPSTFMGNIRKGANNFWNALTGNEYQEPSGIAGVRGVPPRNVFASSQSGAGMQAPQVDIRSRINPTGVQLSGNPGSMQMGTAGLYSMNVAPSTSMGARGTNALGIYSGNPGSMQFGTAGLYNMNQQLTGGSLSPDAMGGQVNSTSPTPAVTPTTRAAGKASFLSGNGIPENSGYIPTRADVWNMKANARRRQMSKRSGDEVSSGGGSVVVAPPIENQGNLVNSSASWRVG